MPGQRHVSQDLENLSDTDFMLDGGVGGGRKQRNFVCVAAEVVGGCRSKKSRNSMQDEITREVMRAHG